MAFIGASPSSTFVGTPGVFTSDFLRSDTRDYITGSVFSSAGGEFYVEQSPDGVNWNPTTSGAVLNFTANNVSGGTPNAKYTISANISKGFSEQIILPFWRIRFVRDSGPGAPTSFQIHARTSNAGVKY